MEKKTVLITGCSAGGLGDALARAFHAHPSKSYRVIATARNPEKMSHLADCGIETLVLDVLDSKSIKSAVTKVEELTGGTLDILLNNAGAGYNTPIVDADVQKVRDLFDLNVISVIEVTQAFFPLLFRRATTASQQQQQKKRSAVPMVVVNTSIASMSRTPTQGPYCATKAAVAMLTETLRAEIEGFGIKVVDLRTGQVKSKFFLNQATVQPSTIANQNRSESDADNNDDTAAVGGDTTKRLLLHRNSIYQPGLDFLRPGLPGEGTSRAAQDADDWARNVVSDLSKATVPNEIWRGGKALFSWVAWFLPRSFQSKDTDEITGFTAFWNFWAAEQTKEGGRIGRP
jgi:1-acylglycerone phosphate reductase